MNRRDIKARGGKIIDFACCGEVVEQLWRLPDGSLWYGDDWYGDLRAQLVPITQETWDGRRQQDRSNA
ncbi:MAG: hypothetical protein GX601_07955 [Anaerolineales bacterium]|nr:hypothetical protein [Anaerolineales bacterium]